MRFERLKQITLSWAAVETAVLAGVCLAGNAPVILALAGQFMVSPASAQSTPAVELERAIIQGQVDDGDLNTAMRSYEKIAGDAAAPRDTRARALLELAGCYEKLGRRAADVYQRIVREFSDQPAAAMARVRLVEINKADRLQAPVAITQRKIETGGRQFGAGDTDGQRVVYLDETTSELIYGDLAGRTRRVILRLKPVDQIRWAPSRDFSIVGLQVREKTNRPAFIAVVKTDGTGYRELFHDDEQGSVLGHLPYSPFFAWSWDSRYLLFSLRDLKSGGSYLLAVSVADGRRQKVMSITSGATMQCAFSPDGRYIAYTVVTPGATVAVGRTYVAPVSGGKPHLVNEEQWAWPSAPMLLDWTADGRYLAIASAPNGQSGLYLFPVKGGQLSGKPILVRQGQFQFGRTEAAGTLVYEAPRPGSQWAVHLASLDASGRPGNWQRLDVRGGGGSMFNPAVEWSPDGNEIVYLVESHDTGQIQGGIVRLRNLATGLDREVYRSGGEIHCVWTSEPQKLLCSDFREPAKKTDIFSIALDSGDVRRVHSLPSYGSIMRTSRDGRALFLQKGRSQAASQVILDIATGKETALEQGNVRSSPDERWLVRAVNQDIQVRPAAGGNWRRVVSINRAILASRTFEFTPDSKGLVYHDVDPGGKHGLYRVPTSGGSPERLGDFPSGSLSTRIRISPDCGKIVAESHENRSELWILENFVPPTAPAR